MKQYCELAATGGSGVAPFVLLAALLVLVGGVLFAARGLRRRAALRTGLAVVLAVTVLSSAGLVAGGTAASAVEQKPVCKVVTTDDAFGEYTAGTAVTTPSVLVNDTVDGDQATADNVTVAPVGEVPAGLALNADGTIAVAASVVAGTYQVPYRVCAVTAQAVCGTAVATVTVKAAPVIAPEVVAEDDGYDDLGMVSGDLVTRGEPQTTESVLKNDTIDGQAATVSNVRATMISELPSGVTFNNDGTFTISNADGLSVLELSYQICAVNVPDACSTATAWIGFNWQ